MRLFVWVRSKIVALDEWWEDKIYPPGIGYPINPTGHKRVKDRPP